MMGLKSVVLALLTVTVALAGCTSDGGETEEPEVVNQETYEIEQGKGALAGILVDDRFRPIDLSDSADSEFESVGYILVQETGQQIQTNENGEFSVVDLEPGSYTLRLNAEGLEAAPQKATVDEGEFSEVQVQARRVTSLDDVIITMEYAAFASCFTNFVILSLTADCTGDRSGDTNRGAWTPDLLQFNDTLEYVVIEVLFDNPAPSTTAYDIVARDASYGIGSDFSSFLLTDADGRYGKMHLPIGEISPDTPVSGGGCDDTPTPPDGYCPYTPDLPLQVIMFGRGFFYQEIKDGYQVVYDPIQGAPCVPGVFTECYQDYTMRRGAGGALGSQATYMLSAFLFDPEADGDLLHETDFCSLCNPDA